MNNFSDSSPPRPENRLAYLGIDVGGTAIKFGMCHHDGSVISSTSVPTEALLEPEAVIKCGMQFAQSTLGESSDKSSKLAGIGLAVPGVLDTAHWCLREVVNLPHWTDRPLLKILENETQLPSAVINDANAAALAEHQHRGLQHESLALITLGTGIGCGLAIGGKGISGDHGCAGEIGHLTVDFNENSAPCNCGKNGHLEAYAGAPAVIKRALSAIEADDGDSFPLGLLDINLDPRRLAEAADQGYAGPRKVIIETATYLGKAIGILGQVIDPAVVLLGGAMTFGGKTKPIGKDFLEAVKKSVTETTLQQIGSQITIEYSSLGNTAGIIGAAIAARQKGREQ